MRTQVRWHRPEGLAKKLGCTVEELERAAELGEEIAGTRIERKYDKSSRFSRSRDEAHYVYRPAPPTGIRAPEKGYWVAIYKDRTEVWRGAFEEWIECWWHYECTPDEALKLARAVCAKLNGGK